MPTVVIVQCTDSKRDEPGPARELYDTGDWKADYFRKQRAYARTADVWYIQSAKHGLLHPDDEIAPYNKHAKEIDDADAWAEGIADSLLDNHSPEDTVVELLGGRDYADPLTPALEARGFDVIEPLRGEGIGDRKRILSRMAGE